MKSRCFQAWAVMTALLIAGCGGGGGGGSEPVAPAPAPAPQDAIVEPPRYAPAPPAADPGTPPAPAPGPAPAPAPTFSVGGTIQGLAGSVTLRDVSGEQLTVTGNGSFALSAQIPQGTSYAVGVAQQPAGQTCAVANGTGTVSAAVSDILVTCTTTTYPIRVAVTSLAGPFTLTSSLGDAVAVSAAGAFTLPTQVTYGQAYSLGTTTVGQTCTVSGQSGTANGQPLDVEIACAAQTWNLGGNVSGATGGLQLQNSDGQVLAVAGNGAFTFPTRIAYGAAYAVSVATHPAGQTCTVGLASGTATADVGSVAVSCTTIVLPPAPPVPLGLSASYAIRSYGFSWSAAAGATYYQLFEDPDGVGPQAASQVGGDLATTSFTLEHAALLARRLNAQYSVRACNAGGCSATSAVVQPDVNQAIGYFKASNAQAGDSFGYSVALSADGRTMAVGAVNEASSATGINGDQADNSASQAGAVYVYVRGSRGTWTQQAYVKASNTRAALMFGYRVALSADGQTLAVSTPHESSNATGINGNQADTSLRGAGAVYVFTRAGSTWSQQAYIKSQFSVSTGFGVNIALAADGDTLAVGATGESRGTAYVFRRSGGTWSQQARLRASNPSNGWLFGDSVALSADGSVLAIGDSFEQSAASGVNGAQFAAPITEKAGAVYVFNRSGSTWTQQAYLKASTTRVGMLFGAETALSADGTTLVVSAPSESGGSSGINGSQAEAWPTSIGTGAVYVFTQSGGTWAQQAYIKSSNSEREDHFGDQVALSGDGNTLAVTSYGEDSSAVGIGGDQANNGRTNAGAVYLFGRAGTTWSQQGYMKATNTPSAQYFGSNGLALSADGSTLAATTSTESSNATGINGDQNNGLATGAGAAYLY